MSDSRPDWAKRVVAEADDLHDKVQRLEAFIGTETHDALDATERSRLAEQLTHMREYLRVLRDRVSNLT